MRAVNLLPPAKPEPAPTWTCKCGRVKISEPRGLVSIACPNCGDHLVIDSALPLL